MLSIDIQTDNEGYTIIRCCDNEGAVCSFCGYDSWPFMRLLNEYGIDCR